MNRSNNHYHSRVRFYPIFDFPDADSYLLTVAPISTLNPTDQQITGGSAMAGYLSDWQAQLSTFYREGPKRVGFESLIYKNRLFFSNLAGLFTLSDVQGLRGGSAGIDLTLYESHQQIRLPANHLTLQYVVKKAYYLSEKELEDLEELKEKENEDMHWKGKLRSLQLGYIRDSRLTPLKGLYLEGAIEFCGEGFGGDFDFQKYHLDGRYTFHVHHLSSLMLRVFGGNTQGESPLQKRFSLAGPIMLRGYTYDLKYLGENMAAFNIELNWPIHKHFRNDISIKKYFWITGLNTAFYYDGGKVWNNHETIRNFEYYHNLGTAFILKTSIMNLIPLDWRIDVAFPLDHDPDREIPLAFWFQIGGYF